MRRFGNPSRATLCILVVSWLSLGATQRADAQAVCIPNSSYLGLPSLTNHHTILAQAELVALAADQYAAAHAGSYPPNVAALNPHLPGEDLLQNVYTRFRSEPVDGAAATPGQIGYIPWSIQGSLVGCIVTGFGSSANIVTIVREPPLDLAPEGSDQARVAGGRENAAASTAKDGTPD